MVLPSIGDVEAQRVADRERSPRDGAEAHRGGGLQRFERGRAAGGEEAGQIGLPASRLLGRVDQAAGDLVELGLVGRHDLVAQRDETGDRAALQRHVGGVAVTGMPSMRKAPPVATVALRPGDAVNSTFRAVVSKSVTPESV